MTGTYDATKRNTAVFAAANPFSEFAAVLLRQRYGDPRITSGGAGEQLHECDYMAYGRIADKVHSTFPVCEIDRICQVNAPQMYGMYLLRKEEMEMLCSGRPYGSDVKELELYHVTTESKGKESLKNGLDWRRTKRSKYGRGVSFSDDVDYADYYANNTSCEDQKRVIIVCAVLVANTWRVTNNNNNNKRYHQRNKAELIVPPGTSDTTVSPNGRVYVKYYDYEFYPLYLVYYRRRPEHLALSRYYNINNNNNNKNREAVRDQRYMLTELEKRQREQRETERRQKEEQLQQHRQMLRQQQERRLQQQQAEENWRLQNRESERKRREELALSHWKQQQQQAYRSSNRQQDNSCLIL